MKKYDDFNRKIKQGPIKCFNSYEDHMAGKGEMTIMYERRPILDNLPIVISVISLIVSLIK